MWGCQQSNYVMEKLFVCCQVQPEVVLLSVAAVLFYMTCAQTFNWGVLFCMKMAIPYVVHIVLYFLGCLVLVFGILYTSRCCIVLFICMICLSLVANVAYVVMVYLDQKCLCQSISLLFHGLTFKFLVFFMYSTMCFLAGLHFVFSLICIVIAVDFLNKIVLTGPSFSSAESVT